MTRKGNGRKSPLKPLCQFLSKLRLCLLKLLFKGRSHRTPFYKPLHQFPHNMLAVRTASAVSGYEKRSILQKGIPENFICLKNVLFYRHQYRIALHQLLKNQIYLTAVHPVTSLFS